MEKRLQKKNLEHKRKGQTSFSILEDAKESMSEITHDFISNLPDEILSNILLRLPFPSAVRTSALSSRWRSLVNSCLADLIVDGERTVLHGKIEQIPSAISSFLRPSYVSSRSSVSCVRSRPSSISHGWHSSGGMRVLQFHDPQTKILQAITKTGGRLHLDFSEGHNPSSHFDWHFDLPSPDIYFPKIHLPISDLYFVKTLSIRSVCFLTTDIVSILVTKFNCLESLGIAECNGLQSLHINAYKNLERLTVIDCPQLTNVHLSCPNLKCVRICGFLPLLSINCAPNLFDAMIDFRHSPAYLCPENLLSLVLSLKNVKILTVTGWIFQVTIPSGLPSAGVILEQRDFWFFCLEELWWTDSSMERKQMDALIFFLKLCPFLKRLFIYIDPMCYRFPNESTSAMAENAANPFWVDYAKQVASDVRLNHLKFIKIVGLSTHKAEMLLVEYLLKEVVDVEPMIIAKSQEGSPARLLRKSSRIVESENYYRIVEVEDGSDLNPRHFRVSSVVKFF